MAVIALPPPVYARGYPQQNQRRQQDQTPLMLALLSFIGQQRDSANRLALDRDVLALRKEQAKTEEDIALQGAVGESESRYSAQVQNRSDAKLEEFSRRQTETVLPQLNGEVRRGASSLDSVMNRLTRIANMSARESPHKTDAQVLEAVQSLQTKAQDAVNNAKNDLQRFGISQRLTTLLNRASSIVDPGSQAAREIEAATQNFESFQQVYPATGAQEAVQTILLDQKTRVAEQLRSTLEKIGNRFGSLRSSSLPDFNREASRAVDEFTRQSFDIPDPDLNLIRSRSAFGGINELSRQSQPSIVEEQGLIGAAVEGASRLHGAMAGALSGEEARKAAMQEGILGPFFPMGQLETWRKEASLLAVTPKSNRASTRKEAPLLVVTPKSNRASTLNGLFAQPRLEDVLGPPVPEVFQMGFR